MVAHRSPAAAYYRWSPLVLAGEAGGGAQGDATAKARSLLRWLFAFWLLVGYALPNTVWQNGSAEVLIRRALGDAPPLTALLVSAGLLGIVWGAFAREARRERWVSLHWLMLLVLVSGYLFDPSGRG